MRRLVERQRADHGKPDSYDAVLADLDKTLVGYEQVLWLYAEGICRCHPERREYLLSVELPFHLLPEVLIDLELLVNHIVSEKRIDIRAAA